MYDSIVEKTKTTQHGKYKLDQRTLLIFYEWPLICVY